MVRSVAEDLIAHGKATHTWIGIRARDPRPDDGLGARVGSLITDVTTDGPAAVAGVEVGDVIVEIEGEPVTSMASMVAALRRHRPGDSLEVIVEREGAAVPCEVVLGSDSGSG
ncbi:MAG: PDZ domain-containing protein [Acidimicrobiales bacterium]